MYIICIRSEQFLEQLRVLVSDSLWLDHHSFPRLDSHSPSVNSSASLLSLSLKIVILLNSLQKVFSTLTFPNMFCPYMNSLFNDSTIDQFIHSHSQCSFINIEYSTSTTMIELKGHSFMLRGIYFNVHIVTHFEYSQVVLHSDSSFVSEGLGKHAPCSSSQTFSVGHFIKIFILYISITNSIYLFTLYNIKYYITYYIIYYFFFNIVYIQY